MKNVAAVHIFEPVFQNQREKKNRVQIDRISVAFGAQPPRSSSSGLFSRHYVITRTYVHVLRVRGPNLIRCFVCRGYAVALVVDLKVHFDNN